MWPRERTPKPNPTVLSPPPPVSAPSSPLATAPGCLVPVNTAVEQSTLGSPSCKVSPSSFSQKYWWFGARPSAANLVLSSGWDGCRNLWVLPEALKRERCRCKTQERRNAGRLQRAGALSWRDRLKSGFQSRAQSGVRSREGVLCGSRGAWVKAGRLSLRLLALEEENASLSAHFQPCAPAASLAFAGHNLSYQGPGPGCLYRVSGF